MVLHAAEIATALATAERSAKQTMIDIMSATAALFRALQSEHLHDLACQRGIELFGARIAKFTEGLGDIARAHHEIVSTAVQHKIINSGELCSIPPAISPTGPTLTVVAPPEAAGPVPSVDILTGRITAFGNALGGDRSCLVPIPAAEACRGL